MCKKGCLIFGRKHFRRFRGRNTGICNSREVLVDLKKEFGREGEGRRFLNSRY